MIIDAHQHVNWYGYSADGLIQNMDDLGIHKSWLLTWEEVDGGLRPHYMHLSVEDVYEAWQKFPDRFIPFYAPDPRRENVGRTLREWVKKGIKGYGEHKVRLCFDNPDSMEMYRLCGELGLPVLFHLETPLPPRFDYWYNGDINAVERAVKACPDTIFIGHGPGWWREISGDTDANPAIYPIGKVAPGGKLLKLLDKYGNVFADLSANSGLNAITRDPAFASKFLIDFHAKILYGSDDNFSSGHLDMLRDLNLPPHVFDDITCRNAQKLISS